MALGGWALRTAPPGNLVDSGDQAVVGAEVELLEKALTGALVRVVISAFSSSGEPGAPGNDGPTPSTESDDCSAYDCTESLHEIFAAAQECARLRAAYLAACESGPNLGWRQATTYAVSPACGIAGVKYINASQALMAMCSRHLKCCG